MDEEEGTPASSQDAPVVDLPIFGNTCGSKMKTVIEVEAGRAYANNQFLKDLFQASVMQDVDYLVIAVRNIYKTKSSSSKDFEKIMKFLDTLYASSVLNLPLNGILIVGY